MRGTFTCDDHLVKKILGNFYDKTGMVVEFNTMISTWRLNKGD